jgi:Cdc6-like AAA superfamily ATPase
VPIDDFKVPVEKLRWECDPSQFEFVTTEELPELDGAIGQQRALRSIDFGLGMPDAGFNLFISGETGTGRASTISKILEKRARSESPPMDWCYVNSFKSSDNPVCLSLPAGKGSELEVDMKELLSGVQANIPKALEVSGRDHQQSCGSEAPGDGGAYEAFLDS